MMVVSTGDAAQRRPRTALWLSVPSLWFAVKHNISVRGLDFLSDTMGTDLAVIGVLV